jgi:aryl-alcohol dehydrogenase-like predicted oxidoreductase
MKSRAFSTTNKAVSEVGLGCWQLGSSDWGQISEAVARETLEAAAEAGVSFFDTADIYGGGLSEQRLGAFLASYSRRDELLVATKFGRSSDPGGAANLTYDSMCRHAEGSLKRLGVPKLWLTQGHCLPGTVLRDGQVFEHLRRMQQAGLIEHFGMSVETVEEAKVCLQVEGLSSLQVIFNVFRQKLVTELFDAARERSVALIVRLPLASGLLSGKMSRERKFESHDHRNYNRDGQAFNVGETFAGVPFEKGLELVSELSNWVPEGWSLGDFALRYCLDFPAVTTVIPGATNKAQALNNARASELPGLGSHVHEQLRRFYAERVASHVRGAY